MKPAEARDELEAAQRRLNTFCEFVDKWRVWDWLLLSDPKAYRIPKKDCEQIQADCRVLMGAVMAMTEVIDRQAEEKRRNKKGKGRS